MNSTSNEPKKENKPLWITERKQLPTGEWHISVWLNTEDNAKSHKIHKAVAELVKTMMLERSL